MKSDIHSEHEIYSKWQQQYSPMFFFYSVLVEQSERLSSADEARLLPNLPWNPQTAIDEADRVLNGEIKYFAHSFVQTGFPPNWHIDYFTNHVTLSDSEGSIQRNVEYSTCTGTM